MQVKYFYNNVEICNFEPDIKMYDLYDYAIKKTNN